MTEYTDIVEHFTLRKSKNSFELTNCNLQNSADSEYLLTQFKLFLESQINE